MKTINIKSALIGALLTSTLFLGMASTGPADKWEMKQKWDMRYLKISPTTMWDTTGWEPFAVLEDGRIMFRQRTK